MIKGIDILDIYKQKYGIATIHAAAPGRANIIGEHTDYNDGYVLPFAINKRIYFAAGPNKGDYFQIFAFNKNKELTLYPSQNWNKGFAKYFSSVLRVFENHRLKAPGLNIVFGGDLPIGAGMSSSSAVTCGFVGLLNHHNNLGLSKDDIVNLAMEAEKGAGLEGGNMDQYSIVHGQTNKAILLDCLNNTSELKGLELGDYMFCLFDTNVSHELEQTEYNTRSRTCKTAFNKIKNANATIKSFRNLDLSHLSNLTPVEKNRIKHVIEENQRVLKTVNALTKNNLVSVGQFLNESHESLRDLYQVSCQELDYIQSILVGQEAVLGARMMGGGFGGCVIALLHKNSLKEVSLHLDKSYKDKFNLSLDVYPIKPEAGLTVTNAAL